MRAFHNNIKVPVREFIDKACASGILRANLNTGIVSGRRGPFTCVSTAGYIVGTVHCDGERKQLKAHQIVWHISGSPYRQGHVIDHINRDKTDNRRRNLRLVSTLENSRNRRSYKGECNPAAKISVSIAHSILESWFLERLSYKQIAERYSLSKSSVANIVRGKTWADHYANGLLKIVRGLK